MKTISHKPQKHHAGFFSKIITLWMSLFRRKVTLIFNIKTLNGYRNSKYDVGEHQMSWNKVLGRGGLKYDFSKKVRKTQQTLVWRYVPKEDIFQVADYKRENYEWSVENIRNVKANEDIVCDLSFFRSWIPTGAYFGGKATPNVKVMYNIK